MTEDIRSVSHPLHEVAIPILYSNCVLSSFKMFLLFVTGRNLLSHFLSDHELHPVNGCVREPACLPVCLLTMLPLQKEFALASFSISEALITFVPTSQKIWRKDAHYKLVRFEFGNTYMHVRTLGNTSYRAITKVKHVNILWAIQRISPSTT